MEFDRSKYKMINWKNPLSLIWVLNPVNAIKELIFGQRLPEILLLDETKDGLHIERTYIPCPHCHTLHDSRIWSPPNKTAYNNWFGLYCISCGKVIPCLRNGMSFILLACTYPLWAGFKNSIYKNWIAKQPGKYKNILIDFIPNPYEGSGWIIHGLGFSAWMLLFTFYLSPIIFGTTNHSSFFESLLGLIPIGLLFGYCMKSYYAKHGKQAILNKWG